MNRTLAFLVGLSSVFAVISCDDSFREPGKTHVEIGDPTPIVLSATTFNQITRLSVESDIITTKWSAGDEIGVYVSFKDELDTSGLYTLVDGSIEDDGVSAEFSGLFKWKAAALPHFFYAYAPKLKNNTEEGIDGDTVYLDADPAAIPIQLPVAQNQNGVGSQYVSEYSFFIAEPLQVTAPRSFIDPELDKKPRLQMRSVFSILEFRFASWEGEDPDKDVRINKLTLTSDNRPLAVSDGAIDITKAYYDTDFAIISGSDNDFSRTVTLDIANPLDVPKTVRKTVIQGNRSREPADINVVFPARLVVMPNFSMGLADDEEENWTLKVDFTINNVDISQERTFSTRVLKPGERHSIPIVLITADGGINPPEPEEPGAPWDGIFDPVDDKPVINDANKTIEITTPAQFAWFANSVNSQTVVGDAKERLYDNYTLKIKENINLGGKEWIPIGHNGTKIFNGNVDGEGHLVSGLYVNPVNGKYNPDDTHGYFGLFGYMVGASNNRLYIKDLRVDGKVILPKIISDNISGLLRVGGIIGDASYTNVTNCEFSGSLDVTFNSTNAAGGIVGVTNGSVTGCKSSASIKLTSGSNAFTNVGGIVGHATSSGPIKACEFSGAINIVGEASAGGIVADSQSHIRACRNTGSIYADGLDNPIGGIVGIGRGVTIMACYNTGDLTCTVGGPGGGVAYGGIGGIVGTLRDTGCAIRACYSRGKINPSTTLVRYSGNIVGRYYTTTSYDFSRVSYNYYAHSPQHSDTNVDGLKITSVMQFTPSQWPQTSFEGWGTGDGSADNTYWNPIFPDSYGVDDWEYPQLYWEVIE